MYYGAVAELSQGVLRFIRRHQLLKAGDRVAAAVSGGVDSVALLRLLLELRKELGIVLAVVHFNHLLRAAEADADEQFVADLAKRHKLEFRHKSGDVKAFAAERHLSVEAAARELRYEFFERLVREGFVHSIATGHTLDDQAETVLLRLVRGAGTRGLAGIYPRRSTPPGSIIRPLLGVRRKDLEAYLQSLAQPWREDGSNRDLRFARNRVRHGILPRLERELNPAVREALAETAEIARAEEQYWQDLLAQIVPGIAKDRPVASAALSLPTLLELPLALRRRVVREVFRSLGVTLEFRHVEEILAVAEGSARGLDLPHDWEVFRQGNDLRFELRHATSPSDYEYALPVPGRVVIPEAGIIVEALLNPGTQSYNPEHCLELSLLGEDLKIRNWRPGDRYWPPHTKAPKKIKELLQGRKVIGPEKKSWPVLVRGDEIIWLRGFAVPVQWRQRSATGVMIRESPSDQDKSGGLSNLGYR